MAVSQHANQLGNKVCWSRLPARSSSPPGSENRSAEVKSTKEERARRLQLESPRHLLGFEDAEGGGLGDPWWLCLLGQVPVESFAVSTT